MTKKLRIAIPIMQVIIVAGLFLLKEVIPKGDSINARAVAVQNLIVAVQFPLVVVAVPVGLVLNLLSVNIPEPTGGYSWWLLRVFDLLVVGMFWYALLGLADGKSKRMECVRREGGTVRTARVIFLSCCSISALLYGAVEGERWIAWIRRYPAPIWFTNKLLLLIPEIVLLCWATGLAWLAASEIRYISERIRQ